MSDLRGIPPEEGGKTWFLWIMAAFVLPALAGCVSLLSKQGILGAAFLGATALALQVRVFTRFKERKSMMVILASLSTWVLMALSFFTGCAVFYR